MSALTHARSHRHLACLALVCAALLAGPAARGQGAITNVGVSRSGGFPAAHAHVVPMSGGTPLPIARSWSMAIRSWSRAHRQFAPP
ncbi:MAG: hypothetical protein NTW21_01255 [Verrucomicrobia bacterium]|nr:hypothetical protein [Verrucomicrobiota bacterium]